MTPSSPLRLRLDGDALVSNWKWLAARSGVAACGAAIKADAYGLGARDVAPRLARAGCRDFFVAHWAEAAAIADQIPSAQIAVLNGVDENDLAYARQLGAIPVLNTARQLALWRESGGGRCHVMLDSGINRMGIGPEQMNAELFEGLEIDIALSHLASADEDVAQNEEQLEAFERMAGTIVCNRKSLANSAGIMLDRKFHFDLTRPGLALYGGIARPEQRSGIAQVVRIEVRVLQIRNLTAGQPVGYNASFRCSTDTRVATLSIGYADGYWRGFSGKGRACFKGHDMPVLGRVSMDLLTVDASLVPDLSEGDWVEIAFDLQTAAALSGMSQYELLTGLGKRAERIWS
ncbi:MAG: alanine racemase [Sphingorhabdus sp.]